MVEFLKDNDKLIEAECTRLRTLMHEAPLNELRTNANGHRWIGTHSMAYADRSREWIEACDKLNAARKMR